MKAIILCAGIGGRMKPLSYYIHKCMMPLKDGRPLLEHVVDYLFGYGIEPMFALSKENHEAQVMNFFGPKFDYSVSDRPLGTAGEVWNAREFLKDEDDFIVYYGDTLTDVDINALVDYHRSGKFDLTTCAIEGVKTEYGILNVKKNAAGEDELLGIDEKPTLPHLRHLPIYVCNKGVLAYCNSSGTWESWDVVKHTTDFAKDVFPALLANKKHIGVYRHKGKYLDVGRLSDYAAEVGL